MGKRGRPPFVRVLVLSHWLKHGPCPVPDVCRATGADRSHVYRILRANNFTTLRKRG